MNLAELQDVKWWLDRLHTWKSDKVAHGVLEHYEHHLEDLLSCRPFESDCDGYCLTGLEYCKRKGLECRFCYVNSGAPAVKNQAFDHAVGLVKINGDWWMIDNAKPLIKASASAYHWYAWTDDLSSPACNLYAEGEQFEQTGGWS